MYRFLIARRALQSPIHTLNNTIIRLTNGIIPQYGVLSHEAVLIYDGEHYDMIELLNDGQGLSYKKNINPKQIKDCGTHNLVTFGGHTWTVQKFGQLSDVNPEKIMFVMNQWFHDKGGYSLLHANCQDAVKGVINYARHHKFSYNTQNRLITHSEPNLKIQHLSNTVNHIVNYMIDNMPDNTYIDPNKKLVLIDGHHKFHFKCEEIQFVNGLIYVNRQTTRISNKFKQNCNLLSLQTRTHIDHYVSQLDTLQQNTHKLMLELDNSIIRHDFAMENVRLPELHPTIKNIASQSGGNDHNWVIGLTVFTISFGAKGASASFCTLL